MTETFAIKIGKFEGPLDLLLQLIEEKKMHISEVSLAAVTESFIAHLKQLNGISVKSQMADFIYVAATLILIKSMALLPTLEVTTEESRSIDDLERRLNLYQQIKTLALSLRGRFGQTILFSPRASLIINPVFAPTAEITPANLLATIKQTLRDLPLPQVIPQILVKKVLSLAEVMSHLTRRIQSALKTTFQDFVGGRTEKVEVIVSFLGMLELVKQGIIEVTQERHFADINMEVASPNVPPSG